MNHDVHRPGAVRPRGTLPIEHRVLTEPSHDVGL